ncbi:Phospholipase D1 [Candidozyma auris]
MSPPSAKVPEQAAENGGLLEKTPRALKDLSTKKPRQNLRRGSQESSPTVIGNAFSFFRGRQDPNESRYQSDEEQERYDAPYEGEQRDEAATADETEVANENGVVPPENQEAGSPLASRSTIFRPSFFARNTTEGNGSAKTQEGLTEDGKGPGGRPRGIFTIFRKKNKDLDRRASAIGQEEGAHAEDDSEAETRERAKQLLSSLGLGTPAINLLASCLCEDEYGIARAPLLLTLLGLKVHDTSRTPLKRNRRFRIDLEYGVAPRRVKWSVERNAKDLLYLHSRFKISAFRGAIKSDELPKYPVPPLFRRNERQLMRQTKKTQTRIEDPQTLNLRDRSNPQTPNDDDRSILSGGTFRNRLSAIRSHMSGTSMSSLEDATPEQLQTLMTINQRYTADVQKYLCDLIALLSLRPESNRLFQFFEVSPISSLLSYETGYTGKQGVVHVGGTTKSQGWRVGHFKANDLKGMIDRRSEKWLLVRNSYVTYVSDINSTTPLEVFLVDSKFRIHHKGPGFDTHEKGSDSESDYEDHSIRIIGGVESAPQHVHRNVFKHLKIILENSERKLVLIPKSVREQRLWLHSLDKMVRESIWSQSNRFHSFAPIRKNCYAQWFVDARDYFWAVSSAIEMAKDTIFIHDWWLSPELYLRRPANGNQQFRIDRLLQRKASQGVKIFVIIYRNVGTTIPIDSLYTKHSILSLNQENIHVIRSPNQLLQNTYFWAHHEKICIIDQTVAFMGGIDLCYGRYDTPDHVLADDNGVEFSTLDPETLTKEEFEKFNVFPGKDYSNTRVKDFSNLDKPYESMYDRKVVPRMPWHDIHMCTSGQPARDLSRHYVQRWNYLVRQKRPSRLTPLLTPPSDLSDEDVREMGLDGSCEVQMLRSAGSWSLGLKQHEQSIQDAYLKLIETSEHFVYIENQFFVTSCLIDGTVIENRIGDALVERIIRAFNEGKQWKAIILIPLVPGFESSVDKPDGSSVRVVMQCQYMSISRGSSSLFAKLRKYGIDPDDYIQFFSLRKWGIIGPDRNLVTEQLYIHAKIMIVDDRHAIIGSANINERSMRGSRDSEVAAIIRDRETITSTMNGEKYVVGKFPHTLRLRLMREHLGIGVDILDVVERKFDKYEKFAKTKEGLEACTNDFKNLANREISAVIELASREILNQPEGTSRWKAHCQRFGLAKKATPIPDDIKFEEGPKPVLLPLSFNNRTGPHEANIGIRDKKKHSYDARVQHSEDHKKDVYGVGLDKYRTKSGQKARLDSARFIRDLAKEVFDKQPDASFLPDIENVLDFLESDDSDYAENMTEEDEKLITARNKERWILLKRIAYLQRIAAKESQQSALEQPKRLAAGLPASVYDFESNSKQASNSETPLKESTSDEEGITAAVEVPQKKSDNSMEDADGSAEKEDQSKDYVPVVSLDEQQLREQVRQINMPGVDNLNAFIDPYGFEDPLDPDFYEDIWFENARRNTEIFRLIFHCQPDDEVISWKEYKHFMKLERAFKVAQETEARNRREKFRFEEESTDTGTADSEKRPPQARRSSQATIFMNELQNERDGGIFGDIPSSNNSSSIDLGRTQNGKQKFSVNDKIDECDEDTDEKLAGNLPDGEEGSSESYEMEQNEIKESEKIMRQKEASRRKRRAGTFSARRKAHAGDKIYDRESAERLLNEIHGHLVLFPADWLARELEGDNWFFNTDRIPPIEIYD